MIPYFDDLSEDPIGGVLCFLSVRGLDVARFPSKVFNVEARRFVAWTGSRTAGGGAGHAAAGGLPAAGADRAHSAQSAGRMFPCGASGRAPRSGDSADRSRGTQDRVGCSRGSSAGVSVLYVRTRVRSMGGPPHRDARGQRLHGKRGADTWLLRGRA